MIPTSIIIALCGLSDSVNPCALVTLFCLLFMTAALRRRGLNASWYAALFIAAAFVALLFFNLGGLMTLLFSGQFFLLSRKVYVAAGIVLLVCGGLHMRDWWLLRSGAGSRVVLPVITAASEDPSRKIDWRIVVTVMMSAVVLAMFSTIWPANGYVSFYSTFLLLPGKMLETYVILLVYSFVFIFPLIGVFVFVSSGYFSDWVRKKLTMVKIILSALTFSLGIGLIFTFH